MAAACRPANGGGRCVRGAGLPAPRCVRGGLRGAVTGGGGDKSAGGGREGSGGRKPRQNGWGNSAGKAA